MKSYHQQSVDTFRLLSGQPVPNKPTIPDEQNRLLQARLLLEETLETIRHGLGIGVSIAKEINGVLQQKEVGPDSFEMEVVRDFNLVETIDGCCDMRVVATGTLSLCGIPDIPVQTEVDRNNLLKFGSGHSRREDGKLLKPPGHQPPDIQGVVEFLKRHYG